MKNANENRKKTKNTDRLNELHTLVQHARILEKHGTSVARGIRTKTRWEGRSQEAYEELLGRRPTEHDLEDLIAAAQLDWSGMQKIGIKDFVKLFTHLNSRLSAVFDAKEQGGLGVYMSLAHYVSEDAGQATLDNLGLNETWKWTGSRDMVRDLFAVRGSKIIQNSYGTHRAELASMITRATDPAQPKTVAQVRKKILMEWGRITRNDAQRIARTETAAVWETTNYNAQRANGVEEFDWAVAKGPAIGTHTEQVCAICLKRAAGGPYKTGAVELPPAHPHCRCTLIPSLEKNWLPPAEIWSGGPFPDLPLVPAPSP